MLMCIELTFLRNRGELAEGWYEPETLRKAQASAIASASRPEPDADKKAQTQRDATQSKDLSDDDVGPALPRGRSETAAAASQVGNERHGPAIPSLQDLELRRGTYWTHACMHIFLYFDILQSNIDRYISHHHPPPPLPTFLNITPKSRKKKSPTLTPPIQNPPPTNPKPSA